MASASIFSRVRTLQVVTQFFVSRIAVNLTPSRVDVSMKELV